MLVEKRTQDESMVCDTGKHQMTQPLFSLLIVVFAINNRSVDRTSQLDVTSPAVTVK